LLHGYGEKDDQGTPGKEMRRKKWIDAAGFKYNWKMMQVEQNGP